MVVVDEEVVLLELVALPVGEARLEVIVTFTVLKTVAMDLSAPTLREVATDWETKVVSEGVVAFVDAELF